MLEILNTFYSINVTIVDKSKAIAFSVADSSQKMLGSVTSKNATISLPVPPGSTLIFNQSVSVDKQTIGFAVRALLNIPEYNNYVIINFL